MGFGTSKVKNPKYLLIQGVLFRLICAVFNMNKRRIYAGAKIIWLIRDLYGVSMGLPKNYVRKKSLTSLHDSTRRMKNYLKSLIELNTKNLTKRRHSRRLHQCLHSAGAKNVFFQRRQFFKTASAPGGAKS